jgi:hypothetical protein
VTDAEVFILIKVTGRLVEERTFMLWAILVFLNYVSELNEFKRGVCNCVLEMLGILHQKK